MLTAYFKKYKSLVKKNHEIRSDIKLHSFFWSNSKLFLIQASKTWPLSIESNERLTLEKRWNITLVHFIHMSVSKIRITFI
jgi:hypothetical protein